MNEAQSAGPPDPERPGNSSRPDEDEVVLGWECADPLLQIEAWVREVATTAAAVMSCSKS